MAGTRTPVVLSIGITVAVETMTTAEVLSGIPRTDDVEERMLTPVWVAVTGQMVVYRAIVLVTTDPTGQFVTVGAQLVIVWTEVVYTVEVVSSASEVGDVKAPSDVEDVRATSEVGDVKAPSDVEDVRATSEDEAVVLETGQTVV